MTIPGPYLIFLGGTDNPGYAKTAFGLVEWAPQKCLAQLRYPSCTIDLGLPDMDLEHAVAAGAKTLVIGVAPVGGIIQGDWEETLLAAVKAGLSIVAGLHTALNDLPELASAAQQAAVNLIDVRTSPKDTFVATGNKRSGKRLITVGTDCAVGKKYAALAITRALKARSIDCTFRASGQTGIIISGQGIPIDAVVSDFVAGAAECLSPSNAPNHWDIIEGQGSLFHPAYAGVSLGLLHGSQPDAIVLCHDPSRSHLLGWPDYPIPDPIRCINAVLSSAKLTNPHVRCVGICVNTSQLEQAEKAPVLRELSQKTGLPCIDPLTEDIEYLVDSLTTNL